MDERCVGQVTGTDSGSVCSTSESGVAIDSSDCLSAFTPRNASTIAATAINAPAKQYAQNNAVRDPVPMIVPKTADAAVRQQINGFIKHFKETGGFEQIGVKYFSENKKAFEEPGIRFYFEFVQHHA